MKPVEWICLGLILGGPLLFKSGNKGPITKDYKDGVIGGFNVVINNVKESNNGFTTCISYIKELEKDVVGPCATTEGLKLKVGHTYKIERATIKGNILSINKIEGEGNSGVKMLVVNTFVRARTPLMELEDGRILGNNDGIKVGEYVNVN